MSGTLQFSGTMPFQFLGCGTETYTRSVMYADTDGITFETPRATNASNGNILPFMVKTRGGQYAPVHGRAAGGLVLPRRVLRLLHQRRRAVRDDRVHRRHPRDQLHRVIHPQEAHLPGRRVPSVR